MRATALFTTISLFATAAGAHPHIFIDTDFDLVFDELGRIEAVRIEWTYDDFYSLLLVEEQGLDADGDGIPEPARLDAFAGQDVDWEAGFPGDFTMTRNGEAVDLAGPEAHSAEWRDGRIVTSHLRPLAEPLAVDGEGIVARAYDPTYFVAYDVPGRPGIEGRGDCVLERDAADHDEAMRAVGEDLSALDVNDDPFELVERDDIGILFADAFRLSCDASR